MTLKRFKDDRNPGSSKKKIAIIRTRQTSGAYRLNKGMMAAPPVLRVPPLRAIEWSLSLSPRMSIKPLAVERTD